ncbi:MAG: hypothetical protein ACTSX7_09730 [Alphaproteobacteria bacterium]
MGVGYGQGFSRAGGSWEQLVVEDNHNLAKLERNWIRALSPQSFADGNDNYEDACASAEKIRQIEAEVVDTPARSLDGLAVKIRFLRQAFILGTTSNDEKICLSVLADIDELIRSGLDVQHKSYARLSTILNSR